MPTKNETRPPRAAGASSKPRTAVGTWLREHRTDAALLLAAFVFFAVYLRFPLHKKYAHPLQYTAFACAAFAYLYAVTACMVKRKKPTEQLFLALFIPLTLLFAVALPLGRVPDETIHFVRSYAMSQGQLLAEAAEDGSAVYTLPANILEGWHNNARWTTMSLLGGMRLDTAQAQISAQSVPFYPPLSHLPQAVGIAVARLFTRNPLILGYAGRLLNLAVVTATLFFAIRYLPHGKTFLLAVCLMPVMLQESMSLSADGTSFAFLCAMISFVMYWREQNRAMCLRAAALLCALVLLLCSVKSLYCLFALLPLLLPKRAYPNERKARTLLTAYGLTLVLMGVWLVLSRQTGATAAVNEGANMREQLAYLLASPLRYVKTLCYTVYSDVGEYWQKMFGAIISAADIKHMELIALGGFLCILAIAARDGGRASEQSVIAAPRRAFARESARVRWAYAALTGATLLVIFTAEYLQWTPVGDDLIIGVQGRYFIPLMLPLFLACKPFAREDAPFPLRAVQLETLCSLCAAVHCLANTLG